MGSVAADVAAPRIAATHGLFPAAQMAAAMIQAGRGGCFA
jgi:hypothetical protein